MYRPLETCASPAIFFSSGPCVENRQCHGPFVDSWDPMIRVESRWKQSWMMPKRLVLVVESKFLRDVNLPYFSCLNPPYGLVKATINATFIVWFIFNPIFRELDSNHFDLFYSNWHHGDFWWFMLIGYKRNQVVKHNYEASIIQISIYFNIFQWTRYIINQFIPTINGDFP